MNESESEFEAGLRRYTPAAPSPALVQGIAASLDRRSPAPRASREPVAAPFWLWLDRLLWSALGATAAIAVTLAVRPAPASSVVVADATPAPSAPALQKVLTRDEALDWQDEGVHFDPNGQPMLKLRRLAVEHQAWADPQNAGVVQVEVPRQEIMYVPVQIH